MFAASAYIEKGRLEEAVEEARAARFLSAPNVHAVAVEAYAQAKLGRQAKAEAALEECLEIRKHSYVSPYCVAIICNGLDQLDEALAWLARAFDERDPWMAFLKVEPKWRNLRNAPQFTRLLGRLKLL